MKTLDRILKWVSWLTIGGLVALAVVVKCGIWRLPDGWVRVWLTPILAAAAIGYVTNWLAIWFLFRPYQRHWKIWGVVPRNQARLATALGKVIPERLLPPEQQTQMITKLVSNFLGRPEMLQGVRKMAGEAVVAKQESIAAFAAPMVMDAVRGFCDSTLTPERVGSAAAGAIEEYLAVPEHRDALSQVLLGEVMANLPDLTNYLKANIKAGVEEYLRHSNGMLSLASPMVGPVIDNLDWNRIQGQIAEAILSPSCQAKLADKLQAAGKRLAAAVATPETAEALRRQILEAVQKPDGVLAETLREKLPQVLKGIVESDAIWEAIEKNAVPYLREQIEPMLADRAEEIAATLDLSGRIESAVNGLKVPDMHQTVLEVAGNELLWLQVLGFFLGGVAGALMAVVR